MCTLTFGIIYISTSYCQLVRNTDMNPIYDLMTIWTLKRKGKNDCNREVSL